MMVWILGKILEHGRGILSESDEKMIQKFLGDKNIQELKKSYPFKMLFDKKYLLASSEVS